VGTGAGTGTPCGKVAGTVATGLNGMAASGAAGKNGACGGADGADGAEGWASGKLITPGAAAKFGAAFVRGGMEFGKA
jgi:hypothetical protein